MGVPFAVGAPVAVGVPFAVGVPVAVGVTCVVVGASSVVTADEPVSTPKAGSGCVVATRAVGGEIAKSGATVPTTFGSVEPVLSNEELLLTCVTPSSATRGTASPTAARPSLGRGSSRRSRIGCSIR